MHPGRLVLRSARGPFVPSVQPQAEKCSGHAVDLSTYPLRPSLIQTHPGCRYLIDAVGLDAQLNHPIRRLKILLRDIERAKAELGDYAEEPLCIAPPKAGQKIDIS